MKRKRVERVERRRPMPEIDLNESADRKPAPLDRQGLVHVFDQLRKRLRPSRRTVS